MNIMGMWSRCLVALWVVLAITALPAIAVEPFTFIGASELKAMIDRREPQLLIIDSRSPGEFQEAHIREAINIPLTTQEANPQALPADKATKLLFYCNGFS